MKKRYIFLLAITLLAVGLLATSQAYAQDTMPPKPDQADFRPGQFGPGRWNPGEGPLHEYMTEAIADEFGISPEKLEDIRNSEEPLWQALDLDVEDFRSSMLDARQAALEDAASDGVISQDQLDWMLEHQQNTGKGPFGPGEGTCRNGKYPHHPQHGRRGGRGMGGW